jgi:hypothetical protein
MPLADPEAFARQLDVACVRVIVDHYLLGDGSKGLRTKRTNFEQLLIEAGFGEWTKLEKMYEIRDLLACVLGPERVLVSAEGFNAVGNAGNPVKHIVHDTQKNLLDPRTTPQPGQPSVDTEASTPSVEDNLILRLNPEKDAPRSVYEVLRDHQLATSENLRLLHTYLPHINKRFYEGKLTLPALSWDLSHPNNLGWYLEKDGLALNHRINLNSMHANRPLAEILRTLTHEMGHEWQYLYGKPPKENRYNDNYHNIQFRKKMDSIGIPCNKRGVSVGMQEPFISFLQELGVEADARPFRQEDEEEESKVKTGSRLKPWSCGCTRIWASIRVEVEATCAKCKNAFERQ